MAHVVVVGAGPAGAALAWLLARGGVTVTLVERHAEAGARLRGDGLMPSGLEVLQRMGLGSRLAQLPQRELTAWSFWVEGVPLFTAAEPMGSPVPCRLIDTPSLLEQLQAAAAAQPGFQSLTGRAARELLWEANGTRVCGVVLDDGKRLPADLVVACDGRGSRLRRQAGLDLSPQGAPLEVLWFTLEGEAAAPLQAWLGGRFATLVGEGGSCALFSTARGAVRLGWLGAGAAREGATGVGGARGEASGEASGEMGWPERLARLSPPDLAPLWRRFAEAPLSFPAPLPLTIQPALAPRWWRPGLLLLGDAAHPMSPVRAQGLNMALRDAWVAAERLLPLLARPTPAAPSLDAALAAIEALRRRELQTVMALQQHELDRANLLRQRPWLRRLVAATAPWSGPLLARRWQAGQPTLRQGLPLP